jgi:hypothetical protein
MDLPAFKKGMALLASDLNRLAAQVRASRITSVLGGRVDVTPGGTSITVFPQPGSTGASGATTAAPFTVLEAPSEPGWTEPKFYIQSESFLMKDENESVQLITPINTAYTPFTLPTLPGAIFIKVEFDENMAILGAWLETGTLSTALWPNYPKPVERDTTGVGFNYLRQKYLRICIAEVVPENDKREGPTYTIGTGPSAQVRKVVQLVNTDLLLEWKILDGLAAKLATPYKRACRKTIPTT